MNPLLKESIDLITDIEFNLTGNEKLFKKIKNAIDQAFELTYPEKLEAHNLIDDIIDIIQKTKELRDNNESDFNNILKN